MDADLAAAETLRLLGEAPLCPPQRLSGGSLNHVFRVPLRGRSVILKHAPPHVATQPHIPLDPSRALFEAGALRWAASRPWLGAPRLLAQEGPTLIMEDLGELPHLGEHLTSGGAPGVLNLLGEALARLHRCPAPDHHNLPVQRTRLEVQYLRVGPLLEAAGVEDHAALGARAEALGRSLVEPGDALVMGDLWPPSVLIPPRGGFHLIDWELSTRGRRAQDLGHLLAWLELLHRLADAPEGLGDRLLAAYGPLSPEDAEQTALHQGCELIARALGPFGGGGVVSLPPEGSAARLALVERGAALLRGGGA